MTANNPSQPQKSNFVPSPGNSPASNNKPADSEKKPRVSTFERTVGKADPQKTERLFRQAMSHYMTNRNLDRAIAGLNEVINFDPEYIEAYYNMGICYSEKGDYDKAIELFKQVIELDPNPKSEFNESSRFNIGNQLSIQRKFQEAVDQFEEIIIKNPRALDSLYNAAYLYFKFLGNFDKAIEYFERVIHMYSLHVDAWYNLGLTHYLKGNKEKAVELWEKLVQFSPDYVPAYYNLGLTSRELGRKDKAMLFFRKYLDSAVKDPKQFKYTRYAVRHLKRLQEEKE